ncbi:MAG TPA: nitrilase-related carbon-nitrogen hydrolase [Armatimonadota bacterium]|jgi:predicted amidohydrolase
MNSIHLAIGSTVSRPGDLDGNLAQITTFARQAADDGVNVLLTPEMSASGYGGFPEVLATAEIAGQGRIYAALADIARETGVVLCAGFVEARGELRHLAHYVVYPDGHFVVQRKHRVTAAEAPLDPIKPLLPVAGDDLGQPESLEFIIFEICGVRCAISICADAGIRDLNAYLAAQGVEVLFGPTGAGGRREDRVTTAELRSEEGREHYLQIFETLFSPGRGVLDCLAYGRALAAVNMCGYDGQRHYHAGHGMIISPMGEVVGFFHGQPNLDRQRPMYAHGVVDVADRLWAPDAAGRYLAAAPPAG